MRNTLVFNQFDMVVSMTEKTINDQLTHLLRMGVIHPQLILAQTIEGRSYVYHVLENESDIPDGASYINAQLHPQVSISESGANITFVLNMIGGDAMFWVGNGPMAELQKFTIDHWAYALTVNMDLYKLQQEDIGKKIKVPQHVADQLNNFTESDFSVRSLFMDFESTNLLHFDPTKTNSGESGDVGMQQMAMFMQFYLKWLISSGNPYVLGYAINQTDASKVAQDSEVPKELKPVGTDYTMFSDPANSDASNLNFTLVTAGGFGHISGSPGTFDTNWFGKATDVDAMMIISHADLLEELLLKPIYEQLRSSVWDQIQGNVSVSKGNEYSAGKKMTGSGISLTISDVTHGDDQYVNTIDVAFDNKDGETDVKLSGTVMIYKKVTKNTGVCTAEAHSKFSIDWSNTIKITATKDSAGNPKLSITQAPKIDKKSHDQSKNTCADVMEWIGRILGAILDAFTFFADGGALMNLFADVFSTQIPNVGNIGNAFANISNALGNLILLPAGQTFFFKDPYFDNEGNFYLDLTYKSDH